ncbi:hypothetical protein CBL_01766 [Carabus blaptoides fortunei]
MASSSCDLLTQPEENNKDENDSVLTEESSFELVISQASLQDAFNSSSSCSSAVHESSPVLLKRTLERPVECKDIYYATECKIIQNLNWPAPFMHSINSTLG